MTRTGMSHLHPGDVVLTGRHTVGADFGIPLVEPYTGRAANPGNRAVERTVRSRHRSQGGVVVWFTDGTKTHPLHGRTAWRVVSSSVREEVSA
jgi:hypothetical protein